MESLQERNGPCYKIVDATIFLSFHTEFEASNNEIIAFHRPDKFF